MRPSLLTASALSLALLTANSYAAGTENSDTSVRIEKLEQEIKILKRQNEVGNEIHATKYGNNAIVEVGKKGLSITSPEKDFSVGLHGVLQIDGREFLNETSSGQKTDITARRIRPIIEATAYKDFYFRFMPDFASGNTKVFDAFIDYKPLEELKFRAGKFKSPIGLEVLQSDTDTLFIERGHTSNLVPSRDTGVQIFGDIIPKIVEYQLAVIDGSPDLAANDVDDDGKKDFAARIFTHPFTTTDISALRGLGIGVAGTTGNREGSSSRSLLSSLRTPGQQTFFSYRSTAFANGDENRINPEVNYYFNSFGAFAEYVRDSEDVTLGGTSRTLDNQAWQIAASYVLTGEDASYTGIKPARPFSPKDGTYGAWEVAARIGQTKIDDDAFPVFANITSSARKATSAGGAVSWYLNDNVRLALDYDNTRFDGGATGGTDKPDEHALFARIQYKF